MFFCFRVLLGLVTTTKKGAMRMLWVVKRNWMVVKCAIMLSMSVTAQAGLLQDGGFEEPRASTPWDLFGNAFLETTPTTLVEGTQSLKLFGNFGNQFGPFSVAFQYVAVDGTDFSVGDEIILEGLIGHLDNDALEGDNIAFIEIAFAFATTNNATDFVNAFESPFLNSNSGTDTYFSVATPRAIIPEKVLGEDIGFIRVAAAFNQQNSGDIGAAWFDNLSLRTVPVPEPGTIALVGLGLAGLGYRRYKAA